jgi:hypothetical protein
MFLKFMAISSSEVGWPHGIDRGVPLSSAVANATVGAPGRSQARMAVRAGVMTWCRFACVPVVIFTGERPTSTTEESL